MINNKALFCVILTVLALISFVNAGELISDWEIKINSVDINLEEDSAIILSSGESISIEVKLTASKEISDSRIKAYIEETMIRHSTSRFKIKEGENPRMKFFLDLPKNISTGNYSLYIKVSAKNEVSEDVKIPIYIDGIIPFEVEIISPGEDFVLKTKSSSYEIDFKFKISEEVEIESCNLIIDGKIEKTKIDIQKDVENIISLKLDRGTYDWQISCINSFGNERDSEMRNLRIKKKSSSRSSSGISLDTFDETYENDYEDKTIIYEKTSESELIKLSGDSSTKLGDSKLIGSVIGEGISKGAIPIIILIILIFLVTILILSILLRK